MNNRIEKNVHRGLTLANRSTARQPEKYGRGYEEEHYTNHQQNYPSARLTIKTQKKQRIRSTLSKKA